MPVHFESVAELLFFVMTTTIGRRPDIDLTPG
jgi:hypothetical protein